MTIDETTIDIHLSKLLDWLIDRRHCSKDRNQRSIAIRAKIDQSIGDLPDDEQIKRLLDSPYFDYFSALKLLEILKETEKESKNIFGIYSSKRIKDWKTILSNYEKNFLYLVECAQILQRNVHFEIPALKKQIGKCQQIREESLSRHNDLEKNIHEIEKQYSLLAKEFSIEGKNLQQELIERIENLPQICDQLINGNEQFIKILKENSLFYREFLQYFHSNSTNEEYLPIITYLIEHGNTTVYQWRNNGHQPSTVQRPTLNYKFAQLIQINDQNPIEGEEEKVILDLDEDFIPSTEGIEIKQTSDQTETIDFETEGEIDWSAIDTVPELLAPALSSNGNHPNSIPDALREAALNGSNHHPIDDGIARGNDALTLLKNRSTYIAFIEELHRLQSFLKQRLNEYHVNETILQTFLVLPTC